MGLLPEDNSASLAPATGGLGRGWRWLGQGILGIMWTMRR